MFQVSYDGATWEDVKDEARMRRILADNYGDAKYPLDEMQRGWEIRTTFAVYRISPSCRSQQ